MCSQLTFSSRGVSGLDSEIMQTGVVADLADCSLVCPRFSPGGKECVVEVKGKVAALSLTSQVLARLRLKVEATAPDDQKFPCSPPSASCEVIAAFFQPRGSGK